MDFEQQILVQEWVQQRWPLGGDGAKKRDKLQKQYSDAKNCFEKIKMNPVKTYLLDRAEKSYSGKQKKLDELESELEEKIREIEKQYEGRKKRLIGDTEEAYSYMKEQEKKKSNEYLIAERKYSQALKDFLSFESPIERNLRLQKEKEEKELEDSKDLEEKTFSEFLRAKNKNGLNTQNENHFVCGREKNILDDSILEKVENFKVEKIEENEEKQVKDIKQSEILKDYLENGWKKPFCAEEAELSRERDKHGFKPTTLDKKGLMYSSAKNYKLDTFKPEIDPNWNTPAPPTPSFTPSPPFRPMVPPVLPPSLQHLLESNPLPSSLPIVKKKPRVIVGFEKNVKEEQVNARVNLYKREIRLGDD